MNDLISRQDAIDLLLANGMITAAIYVERMPSAQPDRKNGKWHGWNHHDPYWQRDGKSPLFLICSECNDAVIYSSGVHWNFCPNCGVKMEQYEVI